jgi:hypothetical protein
MDVRFNWTALRFNWSRPKCRKRRLRFNCPTVWIERMARIARSDCHSAPSRLVYRAADDGNSRMKGRGFLLDGVLDEGVGYVV